MTEMLTSGLTLEQIIKNIAEDARILEEIPVEYKCNCSKDKFSRGILSLGYEEVKDMIDTFEKDIETTCHFCGEKYYFSKEELIEILSHTKKVN